MAQTIEPVRLSQVPRARVRSSVQKYRINFVCILQGGHGHDNKWMERLIIIYTYLLQIYVLFLSWWLSSCVKISGKGWQAT